jgi:protein phosphatase
MDHPPEVSLPTASRLRWSGLTDRGKIRANNEDSFLGLRFDAREVHRLGKTGEASTADMDFAFAVSDGMGGAMAGEFASRITVDKITRFLPRAFKLAASGLDAGRGDVLGELFTAIHQSMNELDRCYPECAGMGATLSLSWFTPGWMFFAHVGDSRIYYLPASGELKQLTMDDTFVGWLYRNGKLSEYEARTHPARNRLQKALGGGNQFVAPQLGAVGYELGDAFVLCTDGITDGLYDSQISRCLRSPNPAGPSAAPGPNPAERLVRTALEHSGRDNTTALVIEVT